MVYYSYPQIAFRYPGLIHFVYLINWLTQLRKWYGHDPAKFAEFAERYRAELSAAGPALAVLRATHGVLTLLTATKQVEISQAAVLADVLRGR